MAETDQSHQSGIASAAGGIVRNIGAKTMDGASKGVELTRKAVSSIPNPMSSVTIERLTGAIPRVPIGTHSMHLAKLFGGRSRPAAHGHEVAVEEFSSDDDELVSDPSQLEERVDRKYFDAEFDGVRTEVFAVSAAFSDGSERRTGREMAALEQAQRERNEQLRAVNAVLKKRILENYNVFVDGVCRIRDVNSDLLEASTECHQSRERLAVARHRFVVNGLEIPRLRRRRDNERRVLQLLDALQAAKERGSQLRGLHASHRFRELADMAKGSPLANADVLHQMTAAQGLMSEWSSFVKDPEALLRDADEAVERCISKSFDLDAYMSAVDAYVTLGGSDTGVKRITNRLLGAGTTIVQRAISDLAGKAHGDVGTVARSVPVEAIEMCVCQICARVVDVIVLVKRLLDCHSEIVSRNDPTRSAEEIAFHAELKTAIGATALEMASSAQFSMIEAVQNFRLRDDATIALHVFYLLSLAIEATAELGGGSKSLGGAREQLKTVVKSWVAEHVIVDRAMQLVGAMENETWLVEASIDPTQFSTVTSLSPQTFKADVRRVKTHIAERREPSRNPFFEHDLALPQNVDVDVAHFTPDSAFDVIVPASSLIGNTGFVLACRVVARYPPLATEFFGWMEQLCALYLYIAAANFVSVSRLTPLEHQHDFSPHCRETLARLRVLCQRCAPDIAASEDFPPVVYEQIRDRFGSVDHLFAISERVTAVATSVVLIDYLTASVRSMAPLLSKTMLERQLDDCFALRRCALELFHVGCHRLANAAFDLEWLSKDLSRAKWVEARDGMQPGSWVGNLEARLDRLQERVARHVPFPSRSLESAFWKHIAYATQCAMINGWAVVKRKADAGVSQMNVDSQRMQEVLSTALGANESREGYRLVQGFLRVYFGSSEERIQWVRDHHVAFRRDDVLEWLGTDREARSSLAAVLQELAHEDRVYVEHFIDCAS